MQIGANNYINPQTIDYYNTHYDVLRTPDFDDKSRLVTPKNKVHKIGRSKNKQCRFCNKNESQTSFSKEAHVFPQSIGNSFLISNYECDNCNQYFGNTIENEFGKLFHLYHSIMKIKGNGGATKCSYKVPCQERSNECAKHCVEISFNNDSPHIRSCSKVSDEYIHFSNNSITISKPVGNCCLIAAYKAIVKMAITVMPSEELSLFIKTISWLLEKEHVNFFENKKLLVRYQMIPGFDVTKYPHYILFRRKKTVWNKPYMLFNLTYGCFSLLIEVPRINDNTTNLEFNKMPFPPIPFHTSTKGTWDLSGIKAPPNTVRSITLHSDHVVNCTDKTEAIMENGKVKFHVNDPSQ